MRLVARITSYFILTEAPSEFPIRLRSDRLFTSRFFATIRFFRLDSGRKCHEGRQRNPRSGMMIS